MKKIALILSIAAVAGFLSILGFRVYHKNMRFLDHIESGDRHYRAGEYQKAYAAYLEAQKLRPNMEAELRVQLAEQALTPQQKAVLLSANVSPNVTPARAELRQTTISIGDSVSLTFDGDEAEVIKGSHRYYFQSSEEFSIDLRVYGYNESTFQVVDKPISMAALITHFFVATPLETNKAIVEKYLCEQKAVEQASLLAILAGSEQVTRTIERLKNEPPGRSCANIRGRNLRLKQYLYNDKVSAGKMQWTSGSLNFDPDILIFVSEIEKVYCL